MNVSLSLSALVDYYFVLLWWCKKVKDRRDRRRRWVMIRLLLLSGAFFKMFSTSQFISIIKLTGIFNVFVQCLEICGSRAFQVEMFIMTMHRWRTWTPFFYALSGRNKWKHRNRHQLCTTLRRWPSSSPPGPCTDFIMTQQTRQNDVAAPVSLCFEITVWRKLVAFFHQVLDFYFSFVLLCSLLE